VRDGQARAKAGHGSERSQLRLERAEGTSRIGLGGLQAGETRFFLRDVLHQALAS